MDVYKEISAGTSELDSVTPSTAGFKYYTNKTLGKPDQQPITRSHDGSDHTLQFMPAEVREEIFQYLLTNYKLGVALCISQSQNYGANAHYNLSRVILQVWRKFYEGGVAVLYESNTFMIEFVDDTCQD